MFVVGVLNLVLGYALAMHWGFGPPSLSDAWRLLGFARPIGETGDDRDDLIGGPAQVPHLQQAAFGPHAPLPSTTEDASDPVLKPEQSDFEMLRRLVATSVASLTDLVARLKKNKRGCHHRSAWDFVVEVQGTCEPYLEKLKQTTDRLFDQFSAEVQELVLGHVAQLESTLNNLQYMDFDAGVSNAMGRLSQEAGSTLSMARTLQQAIEASPGT